MTDEENMGRALELSLKGRPSPNPYVGAVLVKDGNVISEGYHLRAGAPHAEVRALKGVDARGATLYVTLEPCSHHGRTPPCTDAIIAAGVAEVVYAVDDPTEKVRGREALEAAGLKVRTGVLAEECERANESFLKHAKTGMPFVTLKAAMTLDGQIASSTGQSKWITSDEARQRVHELRSRNDAIIVGVGTVLADDPQLTARVKDGKDLLRVILDGQLRTPAEAKVLADENVLIATTDKGACRMGEYGGREVVVAGKDRIEWDKLLRLLGERGITSLLIEGGGKTYYSAAKAGIVDKYVFFVAPKLMPGSNTPVFTGDGIDELKDSLQLRFEEMQQIGPDMMVVAYPDE